jgi:hypothetical protein
MRRKLVGKEAAIKSRVKQFPSFARGKDEVMPCLRVHPSSLGEDEEARPCSTEEVALFRQQEGRFGRIAIFKGSFHDPHGE